MTTPIVLTGGLTEFGTAIDNTGTDNFIVFGAANTIVGAAGNLIINGGFDYTYGADTATSVIINSGVDVADNILLDGMGNSVTGGVLSGGSTISVVLTGLGGNGTGNNVVTLDNAAGTTTVVVTGGANTVTLNGDAHNTVTDYGSGGTVTIGAIDDDLFGFTSKVTLSGNGNSVTGGDENFTVQGGASTNTIELGDGNNSVSLTGKSNKISVGGGTDTIVAGSTNATVNILGLDDKNKAAYATDSDDPDIGVPNDTVTIAGTGNVVNATYENVTINGLAVTGTSIISLGNGSNTVALGGNGSIVGVGDGINTVQFLGSGNTLNVTDPTGVGFDFVSVGTGSGNKVSLDYAAGTIVGTGAGTTTVTQNTAATNNVTINLNNGTGLVTLGDGNDSVTANGAASTITLGNGNDKVTANGAGDHIKAGNGTDTVTANGMATAVTLGNGNDHVTANGGSAKVTVGNGNDTVTANGTGATVVAGSGNDHISATGSGSTVTVTALPTSKDSITVGSNNHDVRVSSGLDTISGVGGDTFNLNSLVSGSQVILTGSNNKVFIGTDSTVNVALNSAQTNNLLTVQADSGNTYGGSVMVSNFGVNDKMDLQGLFAASGSPLDSYASFQHSIVPGPLTDSIALKGGGSIVFDAPVQFSANSFLFSLTTGPV